MKRTPEELCEIAFVENFVDDIKNVLYHNDLGFQMKKIHEHEISREHDRFYVKINDLKVPVDVPEGYDKEHLKFAVLTFNADTNMPDNRLLVVDGEEEDNLIQAAFIALLYTYEINTRGKMLKLFEDTFVKFKKYMEIDTECWCFRDFNKKGMV